jgi:hypothetical protein
MAELNVRIIPFAFGTGVGIVFRQVDPPSLSVLTFDLVML